MSTFERILRQAEAARREKLSAPDLERGFEWFRNPDIWVDIGDYGHRPAEYSALVNLQEQWGDRVEITRVRRERQPVFV